MARPGLPQPGELKTDRIRPKSGRRVRKQGGRAWVARRRREEGAGQARVRGARLHWHRAHDGSDTAGPLSGGLREVDVVRMNGWVAENDGDAGCGGVVELVALMVGWCAATPAWPRRRPEVEKEG